MIKMILVISVAGAMVADAYGSPQEGAILKYFVPLSASSQVRSLTGEASLSSHLLSVSSAATPEASEVADALPAHLIFVVLLFVYLLGV
jgi:hypothetical protein